MMVELDSIPVDGFTRPTPDEVERIRQGLTQHLAALAEREKFSRPTNGAVTPIANQEEPGAG